MARVRRVIAGIGALVGRRRVEQELDEELRAYLDASIEVNLRAGMSREEAIRAARAGMGSLEAVKDHTRDAGWESRVTSVWQDVRYAIRMLRGSRRFAAVAIVTLALGIGTNSAIFSIVNSLLLRPLPVAEPHRLVTISSDTAINLGFTAGTGWNYPMWSRLQQRAAAFDGALAWSPERFNLARGGEMQRVDGLYVSGEFFRTLGVRPLLGRTFTAEDDRRGGGPDGPVAVISYALWQGRFGGSVDAIGRSILIDGVPFTIVGITPAEFLGIEIGQAFDVAVPLGTQPLVRGKEAVIDQPRALFLIVMLRLKHDQSLEMATATIRAMQPGILGVTPEAFARFEPAFLREPFTLVPASTGTSGAVGSGLRQRYERPLLVILILVALVLLIACVNLANLLLARATARRHELSVRRALGASRWRLARQWLIESLILACLGAAAGLAVAAWASRALVAQLSTADSRIALDLSLDWVVLAYTAAIAVLTVVFFGTVPAFRATRVAPIEALKANGADSARAAGALGRLHVMGSASGSLVVAQVAFSLVLLTGAGLFVRTFERLAAVPLGFDPARVLVVNVDTSRATTDESAGPAYYDRLVDEVRGVPGVAGAAASMWTPLSGGGAGLMRNASGRTVDSERVVTNFITPSWLAVYGIDITAGRDFDNRDMANTLPVAIVNQAFVRRFLPGRQPVGKRVRSMGRTHRGTAERTIVGVAADAAFSGSLRDAVPPMMYVPLAQSAGLTPPGNSSIRISVRSGTASWTDLPRKVGPALTAFDRDLAFTFRGLPEYLNASLAQERLIATMSGFFGALALLLAAIGLYGVTAYTASRRARELGVRMALGAPRSALIGLVLSQTVALTAVGVVLGLGGAAAASRSVEALLFGITPLDPATFAAVAVIFAALAGVAAFVPAFRASNADPLVSLRCE